MRSLIIDGQILQTDAWHRGMGKYILQVLDELNRNYSSKVNIALLLNDRLSMDQSRVETLHYLFPDIQIVHCDLPITDKDTKEKDSKHYKKLLDDRIDQLFPNTEKFFLLTSLFLFDFFAEFPTNCHKLLMFYDLTPLLFWKDLGGYFPEELYMKRFSKLYEADHIFSISETTRSDLLKVFGVDPVSVTNINGGFTKIAEVTNQPKGFSVPSKFVLFPTGNLPHKNNILTIKAFNQYCLKNGENIKLLVTSYFSDDTRQHLQSLSDNIIFTGNVSDNELEWLYENAEAVIFSSKYEGLGMPNLDAVANKKPIIASDIPVFKEMSKHAFYYFDPDDSDDLEHQLEEALSGSKFSSKLTHYEGILQRYTWTRTTKQLHDFIEKADSKDFTITTSEPSHRKKSKIAVCSIHPGIKNQIGQLSEQLYSSLKDNFNVDYFFDSNGLSFRELDRPTFLVQMNCRAFDINELNLTTYAKYDAVVYLVDNFALPSRLAQRAVVLPGIVISDSFEGLNQQAELLKQLILDKPSYNYKYSDNGFKEYQDIKKLILSRIETTKEVVRR